MADIHKAGAIIIRNRKLLLSRTRGKDIFVNPGGKLEAGETPEDALIRELDEELGITVNASDFEFFGKYFAEAAYCPGQSLEMDVYLVKSWQGTISPSREIDEIKWVNSKDIKGMKIGSIFEHEVIPKLKKLKLID